MTLRLSNYGAKSIFFFLSRTVGHNINHTLQSTMQGFIQDFFFFVRHTLNNNIIMYNHVLANQGGCVNWGGGGKRAVASPGGCMWVHMHPVYIYQCNL